MAEVPLQAATPGDAAMARPRSDRLPLTQWVWPIVIALTIFFASTRSQVAEPGITKVDDKIVHFSVYGLLATLVTRHGRGWRGVLWSLFLVSAFGASDEWHQFFVPGRSCDFADWVADTAGAAVAVALYHGWSWYRRLRETRLWRRRVTKS